MPLSNAKAQIEAIKAGLDCPMGNPQLPGNVYIFASFQEEVDDLLFAAGESCCPDVPGLFSKPGNPFTKRFGRIRPLPTRLGHTRVPRKLCSTNCASVLASCSGAV